MEDLAPFLPFSYDTAKLFSEGGEAFVNIE
jgi:hypothetical protein